LAEVPPVELDKAPMAGVAQGETGAVGTATFWLSPGVPRPVTPNGMAEPTVDPVSPGVDPSELGVDEGPADERPNELLGVCVHVVDADAPPPSNAALEVVSGQGDCSGLSPGEPSSVAPSGIPPALEDIGELDGSDRVPSGDVEPIPVVGTPCAKAGTLPEHQTIAAKAAAKAAAKVKLLLIGSTGRHGRQLICWNPNSTCQAWEPRVF
jgi:hypothetical protein